MQALSDRVGPAIALRAVRDEDFAVFFAVQRHPDAARMAAFGTRDPDAGTFTARWRSGFEDPRTALRSIVEDGRVVGFCALFLLDGALEVTYGVAPERWRRGIATAALRLLLQEVRARPVHASAAADNFGSRRVLERNGFVVSGSGRAFSEVRGVEIEETFFVLR